MKSSVIRLFAFPLLFAVVATSLRAASLEETTPLETDSPGRASIPVITDYPDDMERAPDSDSDAARRQRYATVAAVIIGTIAAATIGLIVSSADTGKSPAS